MPMASCAVWAHDTALADSSAAAANTMDFRFITMTFLSFEFNNDSNSRSAL